MTISVTYTASSFTATTSPRTVTGQSWSAGDVLIVEGIGENNVVDLNVPTNANLTFYLVEEFASASDAYAGLAFAVAQSDQTGQTISVTNAGAATESWGFSLKIVHSDNGWLGTDHWDINQTESAFSFAVELNSFVSLSLADFAAAGTSSTPTTGSGSATERADSFSAGAYGWFNADWSGTSSGTFSWGRNTYASMTVVQTLLVLNEHAVPWAHELGTSLGSTNAVPNPPGSTTGDLILHFVVNDNPGTTNLSASSGWTASTQQTQGSNVIKGIVFGRILDGSGSDALSVTGAAQDYVVIAVRVPAAEHSVSNIATFMSSNVFGTNAASGNADPPDATGLASGNYRVFAAGMIDMTTGNMITASPANYTTVGYMKSAESTSSCGLRVAYRDLTGITSENPGAFTNNTQEWIGFTVAVPAAVTAAPKQTILVAPSSAVHRASSW